MSGSQPPPGDGGHLADTPASLFEVDAAGAWTWCNHNCRSILGIADDAPLPRAIEEVALADDREFVRASWRTARETGSPLTCDFRVAGAPGRSRWVRMRIAHPESSSAAVLPGTVEDLTVERLREEALLAETRRAREASRLKSEFLAVMSHELRTPIHGVVGTAGLLQGTDLTEEQRELVDMLMHSADATLSVVNNILDISRIEAGRLDLETVRFELPALVDSVLGVSAARAQEKGLELVGRIDPELPTHYMGDAQRLRQVLLNLVSNAVKFTEKGEVVVHVRRMDDADGPDLLRFEVRDTGPGISQEARERLFQAFTQADATITRRFGGSGLGLTISRSLVSMMGGVIGVEGEEGHGSLIWFTVVLPRAEAPAADGRFEVLRGVRTLVVDDNESARDACVEMLGAMGMRAHGAADVDEARASLRSAAAGEDPMIVVLLDSALPGHDLARDLLAELRDDPTFGRPSVILLTPYGRRGRSEAAAFTDISGQVPKPLRAPAIRECLLAVVTGGRDESHGHEKTRRRGVRHQPATARFTRVLVVDDNAIGRRVAEKVLERRGCLVDTASNGVEAVSRVKDGDYALVLMDCLMPEMDGYEATRLIRLWEEGRGRRVPIVAMTARAMEGDRERALGPGMDDYLCKPVRNEELDAVLERWVSQRRPVENVPREAPPPPAPAAPVDFSDLPDADATPLDPKPLHELWEMQQGLDEDIVGELVTLFSTDTPDRLRMLRRALKSGDAQAIERGAHGLKGSSASLGAHPFSEVCRRIETSAREGRLIGLEPLLDRLESEFQRVAKALKEWKP